MPPKKKAKSISMANEVCVFSGFRDTALEDLIVTAGGSVVGRMNKSVTMVICKDTSVQTASVQEAVTRGARIISREDLELDLQGSAVVSVSSPPKKKGKTSQPATSQASNLSRQYGCVDPTAETILRGSRKLGDLNVVTENGDIFDVELVQIDLSKNVDKFYMLQLLVNENHPSEDDEYYVFIRFGRTGSAGQSQVKNFDNFEDAKIFFEDKFYEKTNNIWANKSSFVKHKSHYNMIVVNHAAKSNASNAPIGVWEYYVDDYVDGKATGWYPYSKEGAVETEKLWVSYQCNNDMAVRLIESGHFSYLVDLKNMTQTNASHPGAKKRSIRRVQNGNVTQSATLITNSQSPAIAKPAFQFANPLAPAPPVMMASTTSTFTSTLSTSAFASSASSQWGIPSSAGTAMANSWISTATATGTGTAPVVINTAVTAQTQKKAVSVLPTAVVAPPGPAAAPQRPVDSVCGLASNSYVRVVEDYDVMLNQTNLTTNANKFYRMQVLVNKSTNQYYFWTRYGRVGEDGVIKLQDCSSESDAMNNMEQKFREKTGAKWQDRTTFTPQSNKYEVIELKHAANASVVPISQMSSLSAACPPCTLHPKTKNLMEIIFDSDMFKSAMVDIKVDLKKMPLGAISSSQLDKGFDILENIKVLVNKKKISSQDRQSIIALSGNFYSAIPHSYKRNQVPPAIDTVDLLEEKFEMLSTLRDIEAAQSVMGVSNMSEHPLDTKYRELKADLRPVSDTEPVFNIIDQYIRSTMGNRKVTLDTVWTVARHSEGHSFSSFSHLDNHRLLWHGTNIAVVAAILMTGLRIMPTVNGGRVGRGIYLADELGKSSSYVRTTKLSDGSQLGVLFLVEAALGKMYEITMDDGSLVKAPNGFDSVLAKGKQQPNTANDVTLVVDGCPVKVSQGPVQVNKSLSSSFAQNEYLVYNEAQQRLQFIVTFKF